MRTFIATLAFTIFAVSFSMIRGEEPDATMKPSAQAAKATAAAWLEKLGEKGLVLELKGDKLRLKKQPVVGRPSMMYVVDGDGYWVNFGFAGELKPGMKIEEVRKLFNYVALDRLPTPGLELPGWEIRPQTPVSSFKDGVELVDFKEGRLKAKVKTNFFALYGRDPAVLVPAGAAAPASAYFQIRQAFPLELTIDLPVGE